MYFESAEALSRSGLEGNMSFRRCALIPATEHEMAPYMQFNGLRVIRRGQ